MYPLQWMGAVRMRVQTADENHNNLYDSSLSSNFLWSKKLVFVKKIFINMTFLTSNHCIYNIAFSSEKVVLSESGKKYAQIKHRLQFKTHLSVDLLWKDNRGWSTEALKEALLWIMDLYFDQNQQFKA